MRKKKVWMYYCDYCKKRGGSASAMSVHEKHCSMNPDRECRFCTHLDQVATPMKQLLAVIPNFELDYDNQSINASFYEVMTAAKKGYATALEKLRKLTNNCPMCIFSALRQSGAFKTGCVEFDLKEEVDRFWSDRNEEERENDERAILYEIESGY